MNKLQIFSKYIGLLSVLVVFFGCRDIDISEDKDNNNNGTEKDIELVYTNYKTYAYVQADFFDSDGQYVLEYSEKVNSAVIRPYRHNISVSYINENKIRFKLPATGNYVAYINDKKIILFIDRPQVVPSNTNIVDVYNCDTTGTVNETLKIQTAINDIAGTGKILYFPQGKYLTSQLRIKNKNNLNIFFAKGARLLADTTDLSSYSTDDVFGKPGASSIPGRTKWNAAPAFILIDESENINISGYGLIDGQGRAARRNATVVNGNESEGRYRNFLITRSKNIVLKDIISADPGVWNTHILMSENVTCDNMKLLNELDYAPLPGDLNHIDLHRVNTDGFDVDATRNILIQNCFAYCSDDNVAVKTSEYAGLLGNLDGLMVQNCVFLTRCSSLKVGTETGAAEMKNIIFKNNDVIESDRAIVLYCFDGAVITNTKWEDNRIESCYLGDRRNLVSIRISPRQESSKMGKAQIEINNTKAVLGNFPNKSEIRYINENSVEGANGNDLKVSFTDFFIKEYKVSTLSNPYFTYQGAPEVSFR